MCYDCYDDYCNCTPRPNHDWETAYEKHSEARDYIVDSDGHYHRSAHLEMRVRYSKSESVGIVHVTLVGDIHIHLSTMPYVMIGKSRVIDHAIDRWHDHVGAFMSLESFDDQKSFYDARRAAIKDRMDDIPF